MCIRDRNIALSSNLIGSSEVDFHKDSKSGLNSKIMFSTKDSFVQIAADLSKMKVRVHNTKLPMLDLYLYSGQR